MKILFLNADPLSAARLRIGAETREILARLREGRVAKADDFVQRLGIRPHDVQQMIEEVEPDIVHFSGHGIPNGSICFETSAGGVHHVAKEDFANIFSVLPHRVRLVVLNACYSEPAAELIAKHVDCAIGLGLEILDESAIALSDELYRALGTGRSVAAAVDLARSRLRLHHAGDEAAALRLFTKPGVDAAALTFAASSSPMAFATSAPPTASSTSNTSHTSNTSNTSHTSTTSTTAKARPEILLVPVQPFGT